MNGTCNTYTCMHSIQHKRQTKQQKSMKMSKAISYNLRILRIIQEYFQPNIGRKIRIFSLGRKNNILIQKKSVYCPVSIVALVRLLNVLSKQSKDSFDNTYHADFCGQSTAALPVTTPTIEPIEVNLYLLKGSLP